MIWINEKGDYFRDKLGQPIRLKSNENIEFLENLSEESREKLINELNSFAPYGELVELSDEPDLLKSLLSENKELISYSDNELSINHNKIINNLSALLAVNNLLKNKWFEIRNLNCNEFKKTS